MKKETELKITWLDDNGTDLPLADSEARNSADAVALLDVEQEDLKLSFYRTAWTSEADCVVDGLCVKWYIDNRASRKSIEALAQNKELKKALKALKISFYTKEYAGRGLCDCEFLLQTIDIFKKTLDVKKNIYADSLSYSVKDEDLQEILEIGAVEKYILKKTETEKYKNGYLGGYKELKFEFAQEFAQNILCRLGTRLMYLQVKEDDFDAKIKLYQKCANFLCNKYRPSYIPEDIKLLIESWENIKEQKLKRLKLSEKK